MASAKARRCEGLQCVWGQRPVMACGACGRAGGRWCWGWVGHGKLEDVLRSRAFWDLPEGTQRFCCRSIKCPWVGRAGSCRNSEELGFLSPSSSPVCTRPGVPKGQASVCPHFHVSPRLAWSWHTESAQYLSVYQLMTFRAPRQGTPAHICLGRGYDRGRGTLRALAWGRCWVFQNAWAVWL